MYDCKKLQKNYMANCVQYNCSWDEIKQQVLQVNPTLYNIIESDRSLVPDTVTKLEYRYGQQVGDESFFYFPNCQKSQTMPFCMVFENNFEMYMEFNDNISPWKIYKPGQVFPYTKFLKNNSLYEPSDILKMTAGIKNSFILLNKFSDKKKHANLKKRFNLSSEPPKCFTEQFHIFKEICDYAKPDWTATLLAFPTSWEEKAYRSPEFANYLNRIANEDHLFKRNSLLYDYILTTVILKNRITSNSFIKEIIKYLLYVACGDQSAYMPSLCEANAPISFLRNTYIEVYKSESTPIFMVPHKLVPFESTETVYYSLNKDDFLFKPNQISNLNKLSQEIKIAFTKTLHELRSCESATNTLLYKSTSVTELDINHRWNSSPDDNNQCSLSFFEDPNIQLQKTSDLQLPINSQFLSGCFSMKYIDQFNVHKK